jgi:hypothetical protein
MDLCKGGYNMNIAVKTLGVALAATLMGSVGAFASTIDLTDNGSYVANGSSAEGVVDGVTWEITPVPGDATLTYNTPYDGGAEPVGAGLAFENDGIGIDDDEVTFDAESLVMTFSEAVTVESVAVLDLFGLETMTLWADGVEIGTLTTTTASGDNSFGGYALYVLGTPVTATTLTFVPGSQNDEYGSPDFALAAVTLAPVPVPAAGLLLLGGLGLLGAAKRRRNA